MGKRKQTHEYKDQYGESFKPQQQEHSSFNKGSGGGGAAGKSRGGGGNVSFERHVPKFLQPYAHLLGQQQQQDEDAPQVVAAQQRLQQEEDDADDDRAAEQEAIQRALEENPELAAQLDKNYLDKIEAGKEKELGNKAFAAKDYDTAVSHFNKCIELDPKNAVYFSNRSAAHTNAGRYEAGLDDAQAVLRLKPGWVKGHARAAAAYMGLQLYGEAREAYEAAVKLEPDDQALKHALDRAIGLELQHMRDRKHVFKKSKTGGSGSGSGSGKQERRPPGGGGGGGSAKPGDKAPGQQQGSKQKQKGSKLSFALDEEEEEEEA